MKPCPACNNSEQNRAITVREMMLGSRDPFIYIHCHNCECLYIDELPDNLDKYYPQTYYSFNYERSNPVIEWIRKSRDKYAVTDKGFVGKILYQIFPLATMRQIHWSKKSNYHLSILDVGCGHGYELNSLLRLGFDNLYGIDPFIEHDILTDQEQGLSIYKRDLWQWNTCHDLIIFNHSLEHFTVDPEKILRRVTELLKINGKCCIRIPIADSFAFTQYDANWVQIDAPRHYFIPAVKTMYLLAERVGLTIECIHYDSTMLQFIGSEQYKNNIPLGDKRSFYSPTNDKKFISWIKAGQYLLKAKKLNKNRQGDQAVFILSK